MIARNKNNEEGKAVAVNGLCIISGRLALLPEDMKWYLAPADTIVVDDQGNEIEATVLKASDFQNADYDCTLGTEEFNAFVLSKCSNKPAKKEEENND